MHLQVNAFFIHTSLTVKLCISSANHNHSCPFWGGGDRYGSQLTHKVLEMAEGIDVGEMPSYELVPNAESKKRPYSSDGSKSNDAIRLSHVQTFL